MTKFFKKGLLQVYTGDGKGKTTASLGLSLRAAGQGLKVFIVQFLKSPGLSSGECKIIKKLEPSVCLRRLKTPWWSLNSFKNSEHIQKMKKAIEAELTLLPNLLEERNVDLLILDEMNICLHHQFLQPQRFLTFRDSLPPSKEVVVTGRNAPEFLLERAALVTEMKMIKHPYQIGIRARKGVEF
ncbi:MAG: cob(I)yrinic acid a,c-diamide adenosyltransferase [Nitrospinota bacterium]